VWGAIDIVFLVDDPEFVTPPVNGIHVQLLSELNRVDDGQFVAAVGDIALRRRAVERCIQRGLTPTSIVHPQAHVAPSAKIGPGTIVCAGAIVTTNVSVGAHVQINVGCTVSHDVTIGDFSTLSPGVHVSGHVRIGSAVLLGTGASVINGAPGRPLAIGDSATIAAGACVTKNVDTDTLVAGVPAVCKQRGRS
jgi:sugar O-acyltransferase (sialic acid O-acetyltransferase NeuD family)